MESLTQWTGIIQSFKIMFTWQSMITFYKKKSVANPFGIQFSYIQPLIVGKKDDHEDNSRFASIKLPSGVPYNVLWQFRGQPQPQWFCHQGRQGQMSWDPGIRNLWIQSNNTQLSDKDVRSSQTRRALKYNNCFVSNATFLVIMRLITLTGSCCNITSF